MNSILTQFIYYTWNIYSICIYVCFNLLFYCAYDWTQGPMNDKQALFNCGMVKLNCDFLSAFCITLSSKWKFVIIAYTPKIICDKNMLIRVLGVYTL